MNTPSEQFANSFLILKQYATFKYLFLEFLYFNLD